MTLQFWPSAGIMILIATLTAVLMTSVGRSVWFLVVLQRLSA